MTLKELFSKINTVNAFDNQVVESKLIIDGMIRELDVVLTEQDQFSLKHFLGDLNSKQFIKKFEVYERDYHKTLG